MSEMAGLAVDFLGEWAIDFVADFLTIAATGFALTLAGFFNASLDLPFGGVMPRLDFFFTGGFFPVVFATMNPHPSEIMLSDPPHYTEQCLPFGKDQSVYQQIAAIVNFLVPLTSKAAGIHCLLDPHKGCNTHTLLRYFRGLPQEKS
ncbi:MAG TPA: hypothetical protein VFC46_13550 [Humisphaera sp.]|nr:hypothetical protein [Humisphaera sp.]